MDAPVKIRIRNLYKIFGSRPAAVLPQVLEGLSKPDLLARHNHVLGLRDINVDIREGQITVIMGLSGSGKSTLIRCLTRLIEPTFGEVILDGENIGEAEPHRLRELRRHKMAMVFQHFGLLPNRRIIDNVAYGLEVRGMSRTDRYARAREMIDMVGLSGYEYSRPGELSGGMQQRVGLARALAVEPQVLLFDEPFSALDPLIRRDMQNEVLRLKEELDKTSVFITHDLQEALKLGDRIAIMRDGELVQVGTPEEVVGRPANAYVADFTSDVARTTVLTARWLVREPFPGERTDGPTTEPGTVLAEVLPMLAASTAPVRVVEGDTLLGYVGRDDVLRAIAEDQLENAAAAAAIEGETSEELSDEATDPASASHVADFGEAAEQQGDGATGEHDGPAPAGSGG